MKAVFLKHPGGPEVLELGELDDPVVGNGEIIIDVAATAVSPIDLLMRSGYIVDPTPESPVVLGMDAAGTVAEIGPETETDVTVGDEVIAIVSPGVRNGGYGQKVKVPAASVVAKPKNVDLEHAATLAMNGLTARLALDKLDAAPGAKILVTGATGTLGGYVSQLAKAEGLIVVADARPADRALVEKRGADVILERSAGLAAAVLAEFPEGLDGAIDAASLGLALVPALKDGAKVVNGRGMKDQAERGITFVPINVTSYRHETAKLDQLRQQVEDGQLSLEVAEVLSMADAAEAHRRQAAGGVRGRIVLKHE